MDARPELDTLLTGVWSRSLVLLATFIFLSGCSSWHAKRSPGEFVASDKPDRVRVTLPGGRATELRAPFVRGDSLAGAVVRPEEREGTEEVVSLTEVQKLEAWEGDALKTAGLVVGIGAVTFLALGALASSSGCCLDY